MIHQPITLIAFGYFGKSFLEQIAEAVNLEFSFPVNIVESHMDLAEFFDPARRQYDGNKILKAVDNFARQDSLKIIGLLHVDLFIPILTYIFGQAILNGHTGIASVCRLSSEHYGLDADDDLLLVRFTKVVIHELGHAFGLIHCTTPTCVMRPSTYVEDIDQKSTSLCHQCRSKLEINQM